MVRTLALGFSAVLAVAAFVTPAKAVVVTSGCAAAGSCTLAELGAGGSITVDDVHFGGFSGVQQLGAVSFDGSSVSVSGISLAGVAGLSFTFDPVVSLGGSTFLESFFDFDVTVLPLSTRSIVSATLELLAAAQAGDSFVEVNADEGSALQTVSLSLGSAILSDSDALADLTALSVDLDIQMETFDAQSTASLGGFRYYLSLAGNLTPTEVAEPASLALFSLGLAGLGAAGRRRKSPVAR